jgi:CubicO group peptidase (beta-lactamase class C family)
VRQLTSARSRVISTLIWSLLSVVCCSPSHDIPPPPIASVGGTVSKSTSAASIGGASSAGGARSSVAPATGGASTSIGGTHSGSSALGGASSTGGASTSSGGTNSGSSTLGGATNSSATRSSAGSSSGGASTSSGGTQTGGSASGGASSSSRTLSSAGSSSGGAHTGGSAPGGASNLAGAANSRPLGDLVDYLGNATYPDDFWKTATFSEAKVDPKPFAQAIDKIRSEHWEIHSFLVARQGKLIFERYGFNSGTTPSDPDPTPRQVVPSERHQLWSSTKSILSALVGVAIDDGLLTNVDAKAVSFFPDYASLNPSPEKSSISLADLLTMRSALTFTEGEQAIFDEPDPARAMLSRPMDNTALPVGTIWNYSSGGSEIIAEILRIATSKTPLEYANEVLFAPLGIVNPPWSAGKSGTNHGGFGMALTSREMARFGELFRTRGIWAGKQVVSSNWIDESTLSRCPTAWGRHYGYHWWIPDLPGFINTVGAWGQEIFISRDQGVVVVFTANLPNDTADSIFEGLIRDYVVPALR